MFWKDIKDIKPAIFKRLVGVLKETFLKMVEVINEKITNSSHKIAGKKRGPKQKLSTEDQLFNDAYLL